MQGGNIYVSELSSSTHSFESYHFCRGNSNKRKSRLGIIIKGSGTYIYMNKRLPVSEGDAVFIPENIYCYSEWRGNPEIRVVYLSCFMHYDNLTYEPQRISLTEEEKDTFLIISNILTDNEKNALEAYSLYYKLLQSVIPQLRKSEIAHDKRLSGAVEYITENWNRNFSVSDLAKSLCVSESTVYHLFKSELGETPIGFLNSIRINIAIEYLESNRYSVETVSRLVGFNSENHFRKIFKDYTGTTPLKYRKSH